MKKEYDVKDQADKVCEIARPFIRNELELCYQAGIKKGRHETWDCAQMIAQKMTHEEICECFGDRDEIGRKMIFEDYAPEQAIARINAYKEKQGKKQFNVGDEVEDNDIIGVVTRVGNEDIYVLWNDGSCGPYKLNSIQSIKKTGRKYEKDGAWFCYSKDRITIKPGEALF